MIFDEVYLLIVAQNVYVVVSGTTGRVLLFLPVFSQGYQGSFQDAEGELLPDMVHSVRIRTAVGLCCWSLFGAKHSCLCET